MKLRRVWERWRLFARELLSEARSRELCVEAQAPAEPCSLHVSVCGWTLCVQVLF